MTAKTETTWTPGPWHVEAERFTSGNRRGMTDFHVRATDPDSGVTFPVVTVHGDSSDARLIAAAPDLYAALLAIVAEHDRAAAEIEPGFTCGCDRVCKVARAALAKAEGR